ncbi:hypothetical protein CAAN1_19S01200 [[Candida] anglica]|uniref:RRM domain-containing protein n=1 Tax=[Candida] anglica TaxID=148631 RepID=A0ABP0E587_9ASCO
MSKEETKVSNEVVEDIVDTKKESKKEKKERKKEKKEKKTKSEDGEDDEDKDEEKYTEDDRKKFDEIAIDLNAGVPLSKKQKRLLKKGKLNLEKLAKKNPAPKPEQTEEEKAAAAAAEELKPKKSPYGIWVGNLSFDTTKEDLVRFIVGKTASFSEETNGFVKIEESEISRVNLPKKEKKIKGFAYIDFPSATQVKSAISLSESILNGRKLLIKDATSFEGRPDKDAAATSNLSKNPPSRILFVGNLSFDTTQDNLDEHFRPFGDITRIRMATFEDSGKCKGFAFIDFKDESGPTAALTSKHAKKLINRPLRLEFGEDRSKRTPRMRNREDLPEGEVNTPVREREAPREREQFRHHSAPSESDFTPPQRSAPRPPKRQYEQRQDPNKRLKSSVALATAQRASAAIVPSQGKKISFD